MIIPLAYVSGKFRHYKEDGSFDWSKMKAEIRDEQRWAAMLYRAGCVCYLPLANTWFLQGVIRDDEFIERDCALIRVLPVGIAHLVQRPGWTNASTGSVKELFAAQGHGLEVVNGVQGMERVFEYFCAKAEQREPEFGDLADAAETIRQLTSRHIPYAELCPELAP